MRAREVRGEVLIGPERRRRWSFEEKLRILAQSVAPGSSVMLVCRTHGISSGQLYTWRRQFALARQARDRGDRIGPRAILRPRPRHGRRTCCNDCACSRPRQDC
jgi:transposase-like protein